MLAWTYYDTGYVLSVLGAMLIGLGGLLVLLGISGRLPKDD
jgi:hypothetical protein